MTAEQPVPSTLDVIGRSYAAYAANDVETIVALLHPDVVFHVSGQHPLSGDKVGRDAVLEYMLQVAAVSGGRGGFHLHAAAADGDLGFAHVDGTAYHADQPFTRPLVHVLRCREGRVVEFWDLPFDQHVEDAFWSRAVG